ncbi:MAG: ribonuclease HII [Methanoregulaceae archaeon]|nr:ribonuclease HII [Methanoregulaceae archaeon]
MRCGVDEAGKGSVLGPMVVAAVGYSGKDDFADIEVKDSKQLSPERREELFGQITAQCRIATVVVSAAEIDGFRERMTMNSLVAMLHARAISEIVPKTAYVDACDVNAPRYGRMVSGRLGFPCRIISEHHADERFRIVSAASIVAKVTRDRKIRELADEYGSIGTGYPSDPETITWLSEYIDRNGHPPRCARTSWKTVGTIISAMEQSSFSDF